MSVKKEDGPVRSAQLVLLYENHRPRLIGKRAVF